MIRDSSALFIVHPSVREAAISFLQAKFTSCSQIDCNEFQIYSKSVGLQHLFNVLHPMAKDEETKAILSAFADGQFDSQLLTTN